MFFMCVMYVCNCFSCFCCLIYVSSSVFSCLYLFVSIYIYVYLSVVDGRYFSLGVLKFLNLV